MPYPAESSARAYPGKLTAAPNGVSRFSDRGIVPASTINFLSNEDTGRRRNKVSLPSEPAPGFRDLYVYAPRRPALEHSFRHKAQPIPGLTLNRAGHHALYQLVLPKYVEQYDGQGGEDSI